MAKILCVLYEDPVDGFPTSYARDSVPVIGHYPDGQTVPSPSSIDFTPGELLGSVSGELGLRPFLEAAGHTLVVTSDKEGPDSVFDRELPEADVVISQPFWPAYLTAERIARAPKLKLALTAGIGSDHVDLARGHRPWHDGGRGHVLEQHQRVRARRHDDPRSGAQLPPVPRLGRRRAAGTSPTASERSYDLEGMVVGTVAAGRIGLAVLRRLKPFDVELHYTDRHRLPAEVERELGLTFHPDAASMVPVCDVVTINAPLHPETEHLFDDAMFARMKRGTYLVNTARGKICDRDAVVRALESGQLAGYAGDVWYPQPAPPDHPWRTMPHEGMTPHISGTSLSAQARYAAGTREILECFLAGTPDTRRVPHRRRGQAGRHRRALLQRETRQLSPPPPVRRPQGAMGSILHCECSGGGRAADPEPPDATPWAGSSGAADRRPLRGGGHVLPGRPGGG